MSTISQARQAIIDRVTTEAADVTSTGLDIAGFAKTLEFLVESLDISVFSTITDRDNFLWTANHQYTFVYVVDDGTSSGALYLITSIGLPNTYFRFDFTDALRSKLAGIEANATGDQTGAEIRALLLLEPDTNIFTDQNVTDLATVLSNTHVAGTDTQLDSAGANNITAVELRTHVDDVTKHRKIDDVTPSTNTTYSSSQVETLIANVKAGQIEREGVETVTHELGNTTLSGIGQTINGVAIINAMRVGVVEQTDPIFNGVYIANAGAWTRATDFDGSPALEVKDGVFFRVRKGTHANDQYIVINSGVVVVDTTPINFNEIPGNITFGTTAGTATEGNDSRIPTQDENDAIPVGASGADKMVLQSDPKNTNARFPTIHDFAGAEHGASTLAQVNSKISDATLIDTGDVRLSDQRTPLDNSATNAKFATVATNTIKGRASVGTGNVEDLNPVQARGVLDVAPISFNIFMNQFFG